MTGFEPGPLFLKATALPTIALVSLYLASPGNFLTSPLSISVPFIFVNSFGNLCSSLQFCCVYSFLQTTFLKIL